MTTDRTCIFDGYSDPPCDTVCPPLRDTAPRVWNSIVESQRTSDSECFPITPKGQSTWELGRSWNIKQFHRHLAFQSFFYRALFSMTHTCLSSNRAVHSIPDREELRPPPRRLFSMPQKMPPNSHHLGIFPGCVTLDTISPCPAVIELSTT